MPTSLVFTIFLWLHIIGGTLGLLAGTINIIRRKSGKSHKLVGKIFTFGMILAGFSSLVLSILHPNYFLFIVGVFTLYMVSTAYRYVGWRGRKHPKKATWPDYAISGSMAVAGVVFLIVGGRNLYAGNNFGIVMLAFGTIGLRFVRTDFRNYLGKASNANFWLLAHLQRMIGGYIAALTAFLVVNAKIFPSVFPPTLIWLLPTFIFTPLIFYWSKKFILK